MSDIASAFAIALYNTLNSALTFRIHIYVTNNHVYVDGAAANPGLEVPGHVHCCNPAEAAKLAAKAV